MVGWHHRRDGHEFEQAPGDGDGQGGLACCSPWGCQELDTTERLNNNKMHAKSLQSCLTLGHAAHQTLSMDSPAKNTGVGCHALLQGIFPNKGLNQGLPLCRWILYHLSHQGSQESTNGGFLRGMYCVKWRRQWHPTPVLLPGESHGWRSLVGCSPWGR